MASESFQQEFLESHNAYRAKHNTPPMTLSRQLNASAQTWADKLLGQRSLQHGQTGENLYYMGSSTTLSLTGKEAVDSWYNEIKDYDWNSPVFGQTTGHFTQVVWKGSTELGVGYATDGKTAFVVGHYKEAGNMSGAFKENVLPLA